MDSVLDLTEENNQVIVMRLVIGRLLMCEVQMEMTITQFMLNLYSTIWCILPVCNGN